MTSVSMALPTQAAVMSYSSILGLVFSLFIASAQADITNECRLLETDGSPVGKPSEFSGSRNETDGWVGEPNTRGSMTIVTTCLVTLGLCVWTSIHVDVQIDQLPFYRLRRKVATSLQALIFPNYVVEKAQNEWAEMTRLYEALANVQYIHKKKWEEKDTCADRPGLAEGSLANSIPARVASPQSFTTAQGRVTPLSNSEKSTGPAYSTTIPGSEKITAVADTAPAPGSENSSALADLKQVPNIATKFKRVIGMAEKPEDPDYPFSKEVCFFVVMHGFVRPGRNKRKLPSEVKVEDAGKRVDGARGKEEGALDKVKDAETRVVEAKRCVKGARNSMIDVKEMMTAPNETDNQALANAEQAVANAKASLAHAKTDVNIAKTEVDVANADVKLAKAEVRVATAEAETNNPDTKAKANADLRKAKAHLTKAKAQLAKAEAELVKAELPMFIITPEDFFNAYARNPDEFRKMIKEREKDILDKGNASNIAKLIIMAQVTKLVLQMLGRKAMGLSIAVLELHIFVRILIAGLLYCYWWYKQLDVNEPMELDICGPYWAPDPMWSYYPEVALRPTGTETNDLFMQILNPWIRKDGFRVQVGQLWEIFLQALKPSRRFHPKDKKYPESDRGAKGRAKDAADRWNNAVKQINAVRHEDTNSKFSPAEHLVAHPGPTPNKAVAMLEEEYPASTPAASPSCLVHPPSARPGCKLLTPDVVMRANLESKRRAMWFYIAYAGLHATVWAKEYFPSWYEKWIWRSACIAVAVVPVIAIGLEHLAALRAKGHRGRNYDTEEKGRESRAGQGGGWAKAQEQRLRMVFDWLLEVIYLVASLALLAESFSILRAEDTRTYVIKSWTAELPLGR